MKPCRSEEEFTNNIGALALLLDQMNTTEMNKRIGESVPVSGSMSILERFVIQEVGSLPTGCISDFRDIIRLRSTKFPIHRADSDFIDVVIKLSGEYPPKWSKLYLKALDMYAKGLVSLLELLDHKD